jgi:hypothetical protein
MVMVIRGKRAGMVMPRLVDGHGRIAERRLFPCHNTVERWTLLWSGGLPLVVSGLDDFGFGVMKGDQGLWIK